MKWLSFGTEVGAWSSTPRIDAWSSSPGLFTSRPQYGLEPEGLFAVNQAMSDDSSVGELSTGWSMSRAGWAMPQKYITIAEANAIIDKMLTETRSRFLGGGPKYANHDEAEKAFVDMMYSKKIGLVKDYDALPQSGKDERKANSGKAAIGQDLMSIEKKLREADQNPQAQNAAATALVAIIGLGVGAALLSARPMRKIED